MKIPSVWAVDTVLNSRKEVSRPAAGCMRIGSISRTRILTVFFCVFLWPSELCSSVCSVAFLAVFFCVFLWTFLAVAFFCGLQCPFDHEQKIQRRGHRLRLGRDGPHRRDQRHRRRRSPPSGRRARSSGGPERARTAARSRLTRISRRCSPIRDIHVVDITSYPDQHAAQFIARGAARQAHHRREAARPWSGAKSSR